MRGRRWGLLMWTNENRARYDRSKIRYPSDLTDEQWALVAPLIPPPKPGGFFRTHDARAVIYTLSLHDALPIWVFARLVEDGSLESEFFSATSLLKEMQRSEEHTSELQSRPQLVCRLLLEKKKRLMLPCGAGDGGC